MGTHTIESGRCVYDRIRTNHIGKISKKAKTTTKHKAKENTSDTRTLFVFNKYQNFLKKNIYNCQGFFLAGTFKHRLTFQPVYILRG
jgi:hypothetical protein